jgi:hypothetical protein
MTVVPEIRPEQKLKSPIAIEVITKEHYDSNTSQQYSNSSNSNNSHHDSLSQSSLNIPLEKLDGSAILETLHFDQSKGNDSNKSSANGIINHNNNVPLNSINGISSKNE